VENSKIQLTEALEMVIRDVEVSEELDAATMKDSRGGWAKVAVGILVPWLMQPGDGEAWNENFKEIVDLS
jgi:hypothetical protein